MIFEVLIKAPKTYLWGNFTYFSQAPLGFFCLVDGGASLIDCAYAINPVAKPLFLTGGLANLGASVCMVTAFSCGLIFVPGAIGAGILGTGLRRLGKYTIRTANAMEPKPTLTKATSVLGTVVDVLDDPTSILF